MYIRINYKRERVIMTVLGIILMFGWGPFLRRRALWASWEIKRDNFCVMDTQCVFVELGKTGEVNGNLYDRKIYCFTLEDGQMVSAYKDVVDEALSINGVEDIMFLRNTTMHYTYIPEYIFTNDTYVLLSISDLQGYVLDPEGMLSYYRETADYVLHGEIVMVAIFATLFGISKGLACLCKSWEKAERIKRKKKK